MKRETADRPVAIDLFAGCGGLSLGMEQAGFDPVAAVEMDPIHCAVHEFNFPRCATVCASVVGLEAAEIRRRAGIGSRTVDVVAGGAPCKLLHPRMGPHRVACLGRRYCASTSPNFG